MEVQQYFIDLGLPPSLVIIIIAAMPVIELRGAIPVAINILDTPWLPAFFLAIIGNMLPVPFILRLLHWLTNSLSRYRLCKRFFDWTFTRTRARSGVIEQYKKLGLTLFVAVPIPLTGAWTGAIAAVILGIPFRDAMQHIFFGVVIAGVIVTALSLMGWYGAIIAGLALSSATVITTLRRHKVQS